MSFDDLPPQPPINPAADIYTAKALELTRAAQATTRCLTDFCYGPDYRQRLDVYLPQDRAPRGLPVLMFLYGGGWKSGYKEWLGFMAPPLLTLPAIFVAISVRLAPNVRHPEPLDDYFSAIKWVHDNIAKLGGDPDRICIGGHSSGGHLATLAALRTDMAAQAGLPRNVVKACFPISGIYDLTYDSATLKPHTRECISGLLGPANHGANASPINYVDGNRTPFFIVWAGKDDNEIMRENAPRFVAALGRQPAKIEHQTLLGRDHFQMHIEQQNPDSPWVRTVREWMSRI